MPDWAPSSRGCSRSSSRSGSPGPRCWPSGTSSICPWARATGSSSERAHSVCATPSRRSVVPTSAAGRLVGSWSEAGVYPGDKSPMLVSHERLPWSQSLGRRQPSRDQGLTVFSPHNEVRRIRTRTCRRRRLMADMKPAPSERRTPWQRYLAFPLIWKFAIALVVGLIVGLIVGPPIAVVQPLGDLFLRLLQMLVIPLVFLTLLSGAASVSPSNLGRVGGKVFGYYLATSAVAIALGLGLALIISPGVGLDMPGTGETPEEAPSLVDTFLNIVPENIVSAMAEGNVLAVIFVAVIAGLALGSMLYSDSEWMRSLAEPVKKLSDAGSEIMFKIVRGVLEYGPIGVFALIAVVVGETGADSLLPMLELTVTVYLGVALMIGVYILVLLA